MSKELEDVDHRFGIGSVWFQCLIRGDRKHQNGQGDQNEMQAYLHRASVPEDRGENVGIRITDDQTDLKKEHAGAPNGRAATIPGENEPRDHGLDLEQEKSAEKNDHDEDNHSFSFAR
ncbi:hypothetical protein FEM03_00870 [Phragmitibacter flavus]|uniref:Uncharacterized protein n=1 Tax=Phragmitibacter flavus TaxID=2576071 RepID=A0A5R8KK10_9BACT|nr:hypothetical protein FEM03_00870 [Phragmitibacter flavus]